MVPAIFLLIQFFFQSRQVQLPRRSLLHLLDQQLMMLATINVILDIIVMVHLLPAPSLLYAVFFSHFDDPIEGAGVVLGEIREDVCVCIMAHLYRLLIPTDTLPLGPSRQRSFLLLIIALWSLLLDSPFVNESTFVDVFAFVVPHDYVFIRWVLAVENVVITALIA